MTKTKITFRLVLAALAATVALTACTKEPTPGQTDKTPASPAAEGTRVIAVSFAPQTKTELDGLTPNFAEGDSILLVSYPQDSEPIKDTCIVSVDDKGIATISTNLTGDLTAIYPAKYAQQQKGTYGFIVPPIQTGKFKDANICGTQIGEGENNAQFMNLSTLFIIEPPTTSVKSLTVKSLNTEQSGQRTGERARINISNNAGDNRNVIHVPNGPCDDGKYYVAVATNGKDDVNLSDLSFEVEYETSGTGSIKGIPTDVILEQAEELEKTYDAYNSVVFGTAYTINNSNWHDYVTIAGRKWATANVKTYENYDDYFMWGTTVLAYESMQDDMVVMKEDNPYGEDYKLTWTPTSYFSWKNYPFTADVFSETNKNVFTKYVPSDAVSYGNEGFSDDKLCLELWNDAAYANWGGAWRMPTIEELEARGYDSLPCNGVMMYEGSGEPNNSGGMGYYWSSSLDSTNPSKAKCLYFDDSGYNHEVQSQPRFWGCSIRAIVDDPDYIATEE